MVLTPSSLLCVCRAKLLSAEWFHNSFFQFSLAYDCLELFHTVHVVVCYVVHSFHPQMAYATPSQIKKGLNFIATHKAHTQVVLTKSRTKKLEPFHSGSRTTLFFSTQFQLEPFHCYGYFGLFRELECLRCPKTITANDWTQ